MPRERDWNEPCSEMPSNAHDIENQDFVFLILPGFTMQAFSSAIEVLRIANKVQDRVRFGYRVASSDDRPMAASNGIRVMPDIERADIPSGSVLVVIAGADATRQDLSSPIATIRRLARAGCPVWAISSGVVAMAQTGLLDGREATAHWEDMPYLKAHHPKIELTNALFVYDSDRATCSGGLAASDLMIHAVRHRCGPGPVEEIMARLILEQARDGRMAQKQALEFHHHSVNPTVSAALRLMRSRIYDPIRIEDIARSLKVSQRQLERHFQAEFGDTPARTYLQIRLESARQEVLEGRRPVSDIALDYGFTIGNFSRVYARFFGATPSQDRRGSSTASS